MKKCYFIFSLFFFGIFSIYANDTDLKLVEKAKTQLAKSVQHWRSIEPNIIGYPVNQEPRLQEFYDWYTQNNLAEISMNNVGDPNLPSAFKLDTHYYEQEVVSYFAKLFHFTSNNHWGFVTDSGTDGNNHGIYYGRKNLLAKSKIAPIIYVSQEAHYSIKKLADVQNTELKIIKASKMGQMDPGDFAKQLDPKRPALIVLAIGTTFKGAIDDQLEIAKVLKQKTPPAYYIHLDAALFGGHLSYLNKEAQKIIDHSQMHYDSIAVSGHKFYGFDNPMGIFVTTKTVFNNINPFRVEYLNEAVPTITCSRSAMGPLKFWWKINTTKKEAFTREATQLIENAQYLKNQIQKTGHSAWVNPLSNTVFFEKPSEGIIKKYGLATEIDPALGHMAHIVVMQHVTKPVIDQFVRDLVNQNSRS